MITTIAIINCLMLFSQTPICDNGLDTADVIKIAKRHNAYWTSEWYAPPGIKFDEQICTWTVISYKSKHTDRGDCKNTNGCTQSKTVTLVIDARTKKVLSRDKKKSIFPNYE